MWNAGPQRYERLAALVRTTAPGDDGEVAREMVRYAARLGDGEGLIAAFGALSPGGDHWTLVCACVERCAAVLDIDALVETLWRWPAHLREMPPSWVERLLNGHDEPYFALAGRLDLSYRAFDPAVLGRARHLYGLEELVLCECELGPRLGDALVAGRALAGLRRLDLSRNGIGNRGAEILGRALHIKGLVALDLTGNDLGPQGLDALVESTLFDSLRALVLRDNPIADEGAKLLASAPVLQRLSELNLHRCAIGDVGLEAIAGAMRAGGLRALDVSANVLGESGQAAIDGLRARHWMEIRA